MENLNTDVINKLQSLFGQMCDSRRRLSPILTAVSHSLEQGFFIDADSEEVHQLLTQILDAQQQLSSVEQLKKSTATKRLETIDKNISLLKQNSKRDEINAVLSKIETLVVDSDDPAICDAVKKVKLQAEHLRNKSAKLESEQFDKLAERFVMLENIIENVENFSPTDFLTVTNAFPDNPLIAMALTSKLIHFQTFEEPPAEIPVVETDKKIPFIPNKKRINAVLIKFKKLKPNLELVLANSENFTIQKSNSKKQIAIKSFNNKIHQLFDSVDPLPLFKMLIKTRIFFVKNSEDLFVSGKISKRLIALVPRLFEKLFSWGIVDKITWRGYEFYFLNEFGLDLCVRCFTHTTPPNLSMSYFDTMTTALQISVMLILEPRLKDHNKITVSYTPLIPVARAEFKGNYILFFSLILLGEDWASFIAQFKMIVEDQIENNLRAVVIFAIDESDITWLKMFDTVKFKNVPFFMMTLNGLFDMNGEQVNFELWSDFKNFILPPTNEKNAVNSPTEKTVKDEPKKIIAPVKEIENVPETVEASKTADIYEIEIDSPDEDTDDEIETFEPTEIFEPAENFETVEAEEIIEPSEIFEDEPPKFPAVENIPAVENAPEVEILEPQEKTSEDDLVKADILSGVTNLFKIGELARGMLALHALKDYFSGEDEDGEIWADLLTKEIGFILDDPITLNELQNFDTFSFWTGGAEIPKANIANTFDYLNLAATIKNFFAPSNPTSYQIQKLWNQINDDKSNTALKSCPAAKILISLFNNFTDKTHRAFADCLSESGLNCEDNFKAAQSQLKAAENFADSVLRSNVNHRRVRDVIQQLLKNNGLARKYLNVENFSEDEIINYCQSFCESNLRAVVEDRKATIDEEMFDAEIIGDYLDEIWDNPVVTLVRREHERFIGPNRTRVTKVMKKILSALTNYIQAKKLLASSGGGNSTNAPADKALEILDDLKKQIARVEKRGNLGIYVLRAFTENLNKRLNGEKISMSYKDCLLGANYIELANNFPVTENFGVADFSLKDRFFEFESDLRDKNFNENLKRAYETALKNYDCGILQDLQKNFNLGVSDEDMKRKINGIERQVDKQIDRIYSGFLNDLELARNYSRITDQEKIDSYINAIVDAKKHFSETKNAGIFQRFVNACNTSINKTSLPQRNALKKRLGELEEKLEKTLEEGETLATRYPILANVRRQIDLMNLTVAEDYMNRLETEGGNLLTELDVTDSNLTTLEDFLAEYEVLFRAILNAQGSVEGAFRQRMHIHNNRLNRETQNALDYVRGWKEINSGQNPAIESAIILILEHLGYGGGKISAQNTNTNNAKSYTVTFSEPFKVRDSYPHPFSVFGTEIYSKGLEIIYLSSNRTFDNIAQVLGDMTTSRGTICLINTSLTLPARRALAKSMKLNANLKNIIVIDKVMALYLARFDDAQRGKKMLQAALPFARVQPYTQGGVIAPEMFIGRSEELDQIRDMTGPVFVYGGRQLGKSALLRQVKNLENNPSQLNYAFFIDLKNLNCEQTLKKIVYELQTAKLLGEVDTWQNFSFEMHKLLDGQLRGVYKPKKLLLLLDESDTFLSSPDSESAIDILRELLVAFSGQFKFVLAGLHKVIRFEQNSSFGNLNHISVLPFKPSDAMELLVKPMSYLGFRVASDSLLSAIFSRTNYYPGSIQYYCKMLVDAVGSNYVKQNFDVTKNPPYTLDDDYLKNMLGNRDFQEEIDQKFQITLHLDDDNYYEILALAVAMIYYEHNRPVSVEAGEIKNICLMCGVDKITKLSDAELLSLLDEMVALNLLRRNDGKFEFNRYAFWHMMGTESEVNEKLDSYGLNS